MKKLAAFLLLLSATAYAHPLAPVALWVDEGEEIVVQLKRARVMPPGARFAARLPEGCRAVGTQTHEETSFVIEETRLRCEGSLVGATFGVDGLSSADVDAVVRIRFADGRVVRALLDETTDDFVVPERMSSTELAMSFGQSGLEHLVGGLDHVLLVIGLVLLLGRPRRVLLALTAFTVGHGLSMFAAVLGWIALPTEIAEAGIAATLVWLSWEVVRNSKDDEKKRDIKRPYTAALLVGLVHGLGFAAVFSDAGLNGMDLVLGLGAFHVGIELGQLLFVVLGLGLLRATGDHRAFLRPAVGYVIGAVAYMWLIERVLLI